MKKSSILILTASLMALSATAMADSRHGWEHQEHHAHKNHHVVIKKVKYGHYKRGDYVPASYRSSRYFVNNWRDHHLYQPPRGHRWIKVDGRYLLVSNNRYMVYRIN